MKELRGIRVATAATIALLGGQLITQSALASPTQVSHVRLNPTQAGFDMVLETPGSSGKAPQVFNVSRGNTWNAYVFNAKIQQPFKQNNPAPGIAQVAVLPIGTDGVQVTVVGKSGFPTGQLATRNGQGVTLSVNRSGGAAVAQLPSDAAQPMPLDKTTNRPMAPNPQMPLSAQPPIAPGMAPMRQRAIAPPVGDQAVSQIDTSPMTIDLGTTERIPRLVLRDAPVREVLALLARAAGLNLAYTEPASAKPTAGATPGQATPSNSPTISLDIENEAVQDVFNYVLRIACVQAATANAPCVPLEANRVGRTIFVGSRLPDEARNTISRTIRLNQVSAADAAGFLTTQGAETQRPFEQIQIQTLGEGAAARTVEIRTPTILALRATEGTGPLVLRGLSVSSNDRLNTITLTGAPRKVEVATRLLGQLDARKRQVALNVKIVDVNLLKTDDFNTSFSFGLGNNFFSVDKGAAMFNFGSTRPPTNSEAVGSLAGQPITNSLFPAGAELKPFLDAPRTNAPYGNDTGARAPFGLNGNPFAPGVTEITAATATTPSKITYGLPSLFQFPTKFLARLQSQVTSGNAKVLSDPTVVVQDGETSTVKLVQEVFSGFERISGTTGTTVKPIIREAGLILNVQVDRIDDNGFVTVRVNPVISAPGNSIKTNDGEVTLIQGRSVQSGAIRLRDGQTLILSGIIQDTDRSSVSKLPILGDLPILGALFRSTNRAKQRQEVVVMLTPQIIDDADKGQPGYTPSKDINEVIQQQSR